MACETGIAPQLLVDADPVHLDGMVAYLNKRAKAEREAYEKAAKRRR